MDDDHLVTAKRALRDALLVDVRFDCWSARALAAAARDCGYDAGLVARAFPDGAVAALDFWIAETDAAMLQALDGRRAFAIQGQIGRASCRERVCQYV